MERKIGQTFEYEGKKLQVKESASFSCDGCFFNNQRNPCDRDVAGFCGFNFRTDKKKVIFVEVQEQPQQAEQPQELNLCEILKHCPKGEMFWSPLLGDVKMHFIDQEAKRVVVILTSGATCEIHADATISIGRVTSPEVMLYPSKEQRDWSKFTAPWLKKERFDPKTLKAFDRIIVRDDSERWLCTIFSYIGEGCYPYNTVSGNYAHYIPYNDDTKHLVGTKEEAPEYYRYWEE